jgi:outer membrane receptor protein involved in Fe transport
MRTWLAAVSVAALGAAASHVCAQATAQPAAAPSAAPQNPAPPPDEVTVTGHAGKDRNSPASKTVVSRDDLTKHGDTSLTDALKRIPGVSVDGDGNPALRGLGGGYTQVLINGHEPPEGFSLSSLSPDSIERVEISWSPTADLRGGGIAGTINIILRKAVHQRQREFKLGVGQGNGRPSGDLTVSVSDHVARLNWGATLTFNHNDDKNVQDDEQWAETSAGLITFRAASHYLYHFRTNRAALTPSLSYTSEKGSTTSLQGFFQAQRQNIFRGLTTKTSQGQPLAYADNPQAIVYDSRTSSLDLDHSRNLTARLSLKLKASVSAYHRGGRVYQTGHDGTGALILDDTVLSNADQQSATTSGAISFQVAGKHKLDLGWDGGADWRNERRTETNKPLPGAIAGDSDQQFFSEVRRVAVYAQDDWTISDAWSAYLGVRSEQMDTFSHGTTYGGIHNHIRATSPIVQVLWKPDGQDTDQVRFAIARTFKAPEIARLVPRPYVSYNNTVFSPDGVGNPDLKPELAWGVDLSWEHDWKGGATLNLSAYHRSLTRVIRDVVIRRNGRWIVTPVNGGAVEASGLTVEGRTKWRGAEIHASVSRYASRVHDLSGPGNVLAGQSPTQITVDIERKAGAAWTLGGNYGFSQGVFAQESAQQWSKQPDTHGIDVYALREITKKVRVRFSMGGVLHRAYANTTTWTDGTEWRFDHSISPAVTSIRVALEIKG